VAHDLQRARAAHVLHRDGGRARGGAPFGIRWRSVGRCSRWRSVGGTRRRTVYRRAAPRRARGARRRCAAATAQYGAACRGS
jgi:hypothetical protein